MVPDEPRAMKEVPIVIVSYNTLSHTRRCIESIIAYSNYPFSIPYHITVVDNGSVDGTPEYLKGLYQLSSPQDPGKCLVYPIFNEENMGWVKGLNQGLESVLREEPEYIVFANSDIAICDPRWLIRHTELLALEDEFGATGPVSNFVMGLQGVQHNPSLPPVHEAKFLIGFFMVLKAEVLRKVGLLDERFGLGGNDDLDLSIRIRQAGYKLLINRRAFIWHYGSKTLLPVFGGWEGIKREDRRTRGLLIEKWGEEVVKDLFTMPEGLVPDGEPEQTKSGTPPPGLSEEEKPDEIVPS